MKFSAALLTVLFSGASAFVPSPNARVITNLGMADAEDEPASVAVESEAEVAPVAVAVDPTGELVALAERLNPIVKFYDPLNLAEGDFWSQGSEATVGFLRQSEIKHGRVAMAAFVGYCVQSNFHFPWAQTLAGAAHPSTSLSPEAQWDATPADAKWQILTVIGLLEAWDECGGGGNQPHYMRGGKPGKYPTFELFRDNVHFVLDLYDPFGFNKKMTDEVKERRLAAEINNGRLAMLGIFGFLSADKIEGSVPLLSKIAIPYDGEVMAPLSADFTFFGTPPV